MLTKGRPNLLGKMDPPITQNQYPHPPMTQNSRPNNFGSILATL
jgi:hypothetical protein